MDAASAESGGSCYYSLLGIRKNASSADIRSAYRKLAMKWHPDRWATDPKAAGEANRRFQGIQEAYSVLSDIGKRAMYDAGIFDPFEDDDQDFTDFMQEMLSMMDSVKTEKPDSMEDLQRMLADIVADSAGGANRDARCGPSNGSKRSHVSAAPRSGGGDLNGW